jgi:peptide deformylase
MADDTDKSIATRMSEGVHSDLITIGNPILRTKSKAVTDHNSVVPLSDRLVQLLREIKGAGLAACQIGSPWSVFIVEVRKTELYPNRPESPLHVMINPLITEYSTSQTTDWEGCFSVPVLMGRVPRANAVFVKYFDANGDEYHEWFEGYIARVIQHEYDHLQGKIYLDRMDSLDSIATVSNFKRFYMA